MVQFWHSVVHCRFFRQWTGVSMGTLTGLWICSLMHSKLWSTWFSDTWWLSLIINKIFSFHWYQIDSIDFFIYFFCEIRPDELLSAHQWALCTRDPVHWSPFLWPHLVSTDHSTLGIPHKTCCFADDMNQPSSHGNSAKIKVKSQK